MNVVERSPGPAPGAQSLHRDDPGYPALLREIHDPPEVIHVLGDTAALAAPQLAVVGARQASAAGMRLAQELAARLVAAGLHICSGLARGIDSAAHRGALDAGGKSIAVMGTGIDLVYPPRHASLAGELARSGCLVSEFPPGTPPLPQHFPKRNRIISGLSLGVLVVEARLASGSLITARTALEQGREVFALPWSPLHDGGRGCLQLLRDGAKLVESVDDILEELGPLYLAQCPGRAVAPSSEPTHPLLALLGLEPVSLDELAARSGEPAPRLLAGLSELELQGEVRRVAGGYIRC